MFVYKLSWLPYMTLIAGIILIAEGTEGGEFLFLAGLIWTGYTLYSKYVKKKAQNSASEPVAPAQTHSVQSTPVNPAPAQNEPAQSAPVQPAPSASAPKFCSSCGYKLTPGSVFCPSCGKKL